MPLSGSKALLAPRSAVPARQRGAAMASAKTDRDRIAAALKTASETAMRNSNMGQIETYRINHMISLVERIRTEEREYVCKAQTLLDALDSCHARGETFPARVSIAAAALRRALTECGGIPTAGRGDA
jgi:hypothetical protein